MNIVKWVLVGVGPFLLTMAIGIFVLMQFKSPVPKDEQPEKKIQNKQAAQLKKKIDTLNGDTSNIEIKEIRAEMDSLIVLINSFKDSMAHQNSDIDSLNLKIADQRQMIEEKDLQIAALSDDDKLSAKKDSNAKDLARTFASMKIREIGPIVNSLDDITVIKIYHQMTKSTRKNLLLALNTKRAATLTQQLIN